jgi:hypothetical protein
VAEANNTVATNLRHNGNTCAFSLRVSTGNTAEVVITVVRGRAVADIEWDGYSTNEENGEADAFIHSFISQIAAGKPIEYFSVAIEDDDKRKQFTARFLKADEQ